jgi:hypothetical protein
MKRHPKAGCRTAMCRGVARDKAGLSQQYVIHISLYIDTLKEILTCTRKKS